ncbi:unnamed protein product [Euphydryas editha]|uniref:Lipocalin/cytosolic fatty-acid binding domain-containing protein n=1 Tax=Euphydryas editha TaxID=104508 RepID=A0AAU9V661_EUPED|nr:unnamed protein product [Euphydryas editha]
MYRLIGLILLISAAHGQIQLAGNCSTDIDYEKNITLTEFLGQWYEIERIGNSFENGHCTTLTLTYVLNSHGDVVVYVSNQEVVNGQFSIRNGTILPDENFQFSVIYPDGVSFDVAILKTNFNEFAILYSCQNNDKGKSVMAWKLSRTPTASNTSLTNFDTVVKNNADLVNATWFTPSHSKEACTIRNNATNLRISSIILILFALFMSKEV